MQKQTKIHNISNFSKWVKKQYFHFPVSNVSFLLHRIEFKLNQLWENLDRAQCVEEVILHIQHENNDHLELLRFKGFRAHSNIDLFIHQIEDKILSINLNNPVTAFELEIVPKIKTKSRFFVLKQRQKENINEEEFLLALQHSDAPELPAVYTTVRIKNMV